jgi:dTDP-4-amino-4,6-dideoxygalactose transaminase
MLGDNHRLTALQAALGISQLRHLEDVVAERSEIADRYDAVLGDIPGVGLPPRPLGRRSAWHLYPIEIDSDEYLCERDSVIDALRAEGIESTLHYPAVHLLSLYRQRGGVPGTAPRAERLCERLVTLPLFPAMTVTDQDDVVLGLQRIHAWAAARAVTS